MSAETVSSADMQLVRGTRVYTKRYVAVDDTTGVELVFPVLVREIMIHYEGDMVVARRLGAVDGSEEILVTANGVWETFPVAVSADRVMQTVLAPEGTTVNISVTAWR